MHLRDVRTAERLPDSSMNPALVMMRQGGRGVIDMNSLTKYISIVGGTHTDTADDEHPSFAPNGRLLIYATRVQGRSVLMTTTLDGKIKARLPSATADLREPVWGPFGR